MTNVYFASAKNIPDYSAAAATVLDALVTAEGIELEHDLPVKIHPGAIGNTAYVKPELHAGMLDYLTARGIAPYYIETCMAGERSTGKKREFEQHGFTRIPVVIADGDTGDGHVSVPMPPGRRLTHALIAEKLAVSPQVLVVSHFKGHCMSGFGAAVKMLGIGFASGLGKVLVHSTKTEVAAGATIDWSTANLPGISDKWVLNWNPEVVTSGREFIERMTESAWAAAHGKRHVYVTYAINLVTNCDCDGKPLTPVYPDIGVFAGTDPVAIDRAVFDTIAGTVGQPPFEGTEMFAYAESIGLGSASYGLVECPAPAVHA